MQKKLSYLVGLASLTVLLSACGGGSKNTTGPSSQVGTAKSSTATVASSTATAASSLPKSSTAKSSAGTIASSSAASQVATVSLVLPESLEVVTK
jgi:hypothetical protein